MKISNEAREALLGGMNVVGTEVIEATDNTKDRDTVNFHLDTGLILSIECHPIKGLILTAAMPVGPDDSERTGWCTCPVRPFGNPPVFDPKCPQHKDLIVVTKP